MSSSRPLWRTAALTAALLALPAAAAATTGTTAPSVVSGPKASCTLPTLEGQSPGTSAKHEIESGGRTRTYVLRLPDGYDRRSDWPLVVAYHGRGSTGAEVEGYSKLSTLPAVVAYPDGEIGTGSGYRKAWQGAPYASKGVDDVAFTEDLFDELQGHMCLDPQRTYVTGKSNGGGLAALVACRLPERVAAVAPVAAAYYPGTREGCAPGASVPVIDLHGTGDTTIPYAGDADRDLPAIPTQVAQWAARNDCDEQARPQTTRREIIRYRWTGCDADVEHLAVSGGGHVWPGSDIYSGGGYTTQAVDAHRVIWDFVSRQHLGEQEVTR